MKKAIVIIGFLLSAVTICRAQQEIRVNPSGVNVYSQGATTVFLTYGNLGEYRPDETAWCGELIPAAPAIGSRCAPGTIYGALPKRYDISRRSGSGGYTDIVSVPAAIARKAYQAAAAGQPSEFFYVRRFVHPAGGPDQFVAVTMRLSGAGAGTPFSLTDVRLGFGDSNGATATDPLVFFVEPGGKIPQVRAEIRHTGTGRLKGRWEVVRPGDPLPEPRDLLTEASLPVEERGTQARFTQIGRFNLFLPPGGRYTLSGPAPSQMPNNVPGQYLILLRIEASDDGENGSDLSFVGAGSILVSAGAAAGFPLPVLRYVVGNGDSPIATAAPPTGLSLILPGDGVTIPAGTPVDFVWNELPEAVYYRLEIEDDAGQLVHSAVLKASERSYRAPSWLRAGNRSLHWRVIALDAAGSLMTGTDRRALRLAERR